MGLLTGTAHEICSGWSGVAAYLFLMWVLSKCCWCLCSSLPPSSQPPAFLLLQTAGGTGL